MVASKAKKLKRLLQALVHDEPEPWNAFTEEDAKSFFSFIEAFQIEDATITYLEEHPQAGKQELYNATDDMTTGSIPPGQEDLLDELLEDE